MNYIKKCIVSRLENEMINGDLSDLGNSISEIVKLFITEESGYTKEDFIAGIQHGLDDHKE